MLHLRVARLDVHSSLEIMQVEKPHVMFVVSAEVFNEGIKYADTFLAATQFCLLQRDADHSSLRLTAEIKFIKPVNGIIKCKRATEILLLQSTISHRLAFIEKNAYTSIEAGVNNMGKRISIFSQH